MEIHGHEAARVLEMNQKTVSNVLSRLEEENILRSKTEGRNRVYKLNKLNPTLMNVLSMVEEEKAVSLRKTSRLGKDFVDRLLEGGSPLVVIFGSYAKGTARKDSDVDILVISPFDTNLREMERFYGIKASIKEYSMQEFIDGVEKEDHLIKEILNSHVILLGSNLFVKIALEGLHE